MFLIFRASMSEWDRTIGVGGKCERLNLLFYANLILLMWILNICIVNFLMLLSTYFKEQEAHCDESW